MTNTTQTEPRTVADLIAEYGIPCTMDLDREAPLPYAIWTMRNGEREEIIGAGDTAADAIDDAESALMFWRANR